MSESTAVEAPATKEPFFKMSSIPGANILVPLFLGCLLNTLFLRFDKWQGDMKSRQTGSLVSDRMGETNTYALYNLQERGVLFVKPQVKVYEGMIVGENARAVDLDVNPIKEKKLSNMRTTSADEAMRLVPVREMSLERALEFIADDELIEVTPKAIRLRKRVLKANERPKK